MATSVIKSTSNNIRFLDTSFYEELSIGTSATKASDRWAYIHYFVPAQSTFMVFINGAKVFEHYSSVIENANAMFPVKAGQTILATCSGEEGHTCGRLYAMM